MPPGSFSYTRTVQTYIMGSLANVADRRAHRGLSAPWELLYTILVCFSLQPSANSGIRLDRTQPGPASWLMRARE